MLTLPLFSSPETAPAEAALPTGTGKATPRQMELGQFMTPAWASLALIQRHFSDLTSADLVLEPTCGDGSFLGAIPDYVPAIGIEIDPELAALARERTGRTVITGDFRTTKLNDNPTAIIGNPPFQTDTIDQLLDAAKQWLPTDGRCALLLPSYAIQTPSRVCRYNEDWSIFAECLPRTLFKGLQCPLSFVMFRKDQKRALFGLALYAESYDIESMPAPVQALLKNNRATWEAVVESALKASGGSAKLETIYKAIEPKRPTGNPYWKEQVRKVLRQPRFRREGPAMYALAA